MKKLILGFGIFLIYSSVMAQGMTEMITDRPDQTESASTLLPKQLQLESGFSYEHFNSALHVTTYNSTLARYGLVQNVELRLGLEYLGLHESLDGGEYNASGLGPIVVGAKFRLREEDNQLPRLALLTNFTIPNTGASGFENKNLGAEFRLNGDYTINQLMSFGGNIGVEWTGAEGEDFAIGIYTASIGLDVSDKVGAFAELYGFLPAEGKNDHRWDGGITYLATDNLQLDFSAGIGLSKYSPDFFIGLGFSIRMP